MCGKDDDPMLVPIFKGSAACGAAKTEAITMPLNFWILGNRPSSLEVDFSEETSVYALIHAIKEEATPTLINIAHNAIDLWKVSIPSTISAVAERTIFTPELSLSSH